MIRVRRSSRWSMGCRRILRRLICRWRKRRATVWRCSIPRERELRLSGIHDGLVGASGELGRANGVLIVSVFDRLLLGRRFRFVYVYLPSVTLLCHS